jgi:hypothetical protein
LMQRLAAPTRADDSELKFVRRAKDLHELVGARWPQGRLRKLAQRLGCPKKEANGLGVGTLIGLIARAVSVAHAQGFDLQTDHEEIWKKSAEEGEQLSEIDLLVALNDVRQIDAHGLGTADQARVNRLLQALGRSRAEMAAGWGLAIDELLDRTADALDELRKRLGS